MRWLKYRARTRLSRDELHTCGDRTVINGLLAPTNSTDELGPRDKTKDVEVIPGPKKAIPRQNNSEMLLATVEHQGLNEPTPAFCSSATTRQESNAQEPCLNAKNRMDGA